MATENQKQEEVLENMRRLQLDVAVRSIQWSYAIYWSISSTKPGMLEWGDGYYNGEIKTRKSVQAGESLADHPVLQRSEELRELYESLYGGETKPQAAKRFSAALCPEDLTDTEWYYLVCMSFVFNIGQGLPGRTLAKNETIWLCNANSADTQVFSRSVLAKSASIKTIVCFPHFGGVVELGVTDLVLEDQNLIQHVKTCFSATPVPIFSKIPSEQVRLELDRANMTETGCDPPLDSREVYICSPDNCSDSFGATRLRNKSDVFEGIEGEVPQLQSRKFKGDRISCWVNTSMSDSVSQTYENPKGISPISKDTQECSQQKDDKIHYQSVLSTLLKGSNQFILGPYFKRGKRESSFVNWTKDGLSRAKTVQTRTQQKLLKKVLLEVARMHENCQLESIKNNGKRESPSTSEVGETYRNHILSERKRRGELNERYSILGSLIPSGGKVDKVSVLDKTIEYLRELERRVKEPELSKRVVELESRTRSKPHDDIERTSENNGPNQVNNIKKPLRNERKARNMDGSRVGNSQHLSRNSSTVNITIDADDKNVSIEIKCSWRESMLIEILEAINELQMDSLSVQSFNANGILSSTIKAQVWSHNTTLKVDCSGIFDRDY
ncbi:transcription factor GLABRA 3-like isoform X1 [Olea europaea subsp. europaea]|uniref:Transcription factor GLABRA 3-like isoform X1 n=1 Tax=Olea europaea subsp. europaea TaxID=158383 RepID=A0A8S0R8W9_OLEEU|nr:transcription factor GLABRA 3-like isoform X1 [Olea europaea subsp. europaea]